MIRSSLQRLHRAFPPPEYLTMPAVGLDISDEAVKVVELTMTPEGVRLGKFGSFPVTKGIIDGGVIKYPERLVGVLKDAQHEYNFTFVYASLPDEHAYLFQTEVARGAPYKELRTSLEFKLKENVPLAPEEVLFDFDLDGQAGGKKTQEATVSVYPREVAEMYTAAMHEAAIVPLSLETEGEATVRSIVPWDSKETIMVVDIGKVGTELSIVVEGEMVFATSLDVSGDQFTHALERFFQCSYVEAERIKAEKGFIKNKENMDVFETLMGPVTNLRDDINKHLAYWHMHRGLQSSESRSVASIILTGGGANLKGLRQYLTATMNIPIERANAWVNITDLENYIPAMPQEDSLAYATAIGLALRSFR